MKRIQTAVLTLVVIVCAGCASSERMLRLGADCSNYSQPESSRLADEGKTPQAGSACNSKLDDSAVNLWPLYLSNARYTSILWPMIDWDDYGWAFRPLYNKEGMEHSVLFPLCAWNFHNKDGWFTLFYWNKANFGTLFLFNTPREKGLHYYGPFWFYTSDYKYPLQDKAARDKKWGIFPLLWMNMGVDRDYSMFYPIAGWNSNFNIQKHLNFFGPFWNWDHECGLCPIFHWNYSGKGNLQSYFFPLYYNSRYMFLSIPYCYGKREYGKVGRSQNDVLNCGRKMQLNSTEWRSILGAYWGKDQLKFVSDSKEAENRYFGFTPLFSRETMGDWSKTGFGPWNWLAGWNCGPNVKQFHLLGPIGFRRMKKENTEMDFWNTEKRFSNFSTLLLCHYGEEEHLLWKEPEGTQYTSVPGYLDLTFQLYRLAAGGKKQQLQNLQQIQRALRLCQITEPMPKTQMEAGILAYKLEQTFHAEKQHRFYHSFFPLWFYSNGGSRTDLLLPVLFSSWSTEKNGDSDSIFATPLVFRKTHRTSRRYMASLRDPETADIGQITREPYSCTEYDLFRLLGWQRERFSVPFWKQGVTNEVKKQKDAYWLDCGDGKISWPEAAKLEKEYVGKNTELRTYFRTSYISDLLYLSQKSSVGECRMYLLGGLLAQREKARNSDDMHVMFFLYRYQKKGDAEREFIFPFILKQKEGNKEKFSFCWRLFDREYTDGKCTGGHILFFPY